MENERPIEKLLRAFAKKRRAEAGPPLEMHPATRRLLQGEVSRQFPQATSGRINPAELPRNLWLRLVWALPVLLVLAVGIWAIVYSPDQPGAKIDFAKSTTAPQTSLKELTVADPREQPAVEAGRASESDRLTLAYADKSLPKDNEPASGLKQEKSKLQPPPMRAENAARQRGVAGAPTTPEAVSIAKAQNEPVTVNRDEQSVALAFEVRRAPAEEGAVLAGGATVPGRAAPPAPRTDNTGAATGPGYSSRRFGGDVPPPSSVAVAPASAPAPTVARKPALAESKQQAAGARTPVVVQRFIQTQPVSGLGGQAKRGSAPAQVLRGFQLEQTGNQLRVVDSDGSSYTGSVEPVVATTADQRPTAATGKAGESKASYGVAAQPADDGAAWNYQAGQNYSFRVTGTNRTRQQLVVFEGNLVTPTNVAASTQMFYSAAPAQRGQLGPQQISSPLLLNSTISGKVRLGADQEMQIKAVPVPP